MPTRLRDRADTDFSAYLDTEVLVGLRDTEKSVYFQELERQLAAETAQSDAERKQLMRHRRAVQARIETLHAGNDDLRKVHTRIRADAFTYTADPASSLYEGGLNATWTPDATDPYKGVFHFEGSAGFNNSANKSWFPLKYDPSDSDWSDYKGFEFTAMLKTVGGTPSYYDAVYGFRKSIKCLHQLDADSSDTHFVNPGSQYFRKKACDAPPAAAVIDYVGNDKNLLFSMRPGYRIYSKLVNRMADGTDRIVSNIQLLDIPKCITHLTQAQITAQHSAAKKWAPTRTRFVFEWDQVTDPRDNVDTLYVDKNQGTTSGSAAPRRYQSKKRYPQTADPLGDGVTNNQGAVGYDKDCPRDNVVSLEINPYFKLGTWIGATEICELEISDIKLFK